MRRVKSEEARRNFRSLLDEAERGEPIEVQRYDRPVAVLVPADWYRLVLDYIALTDYIGLTLANDPAALAWRTLSKSLNEARRVAGLPERRKPTDTRVVRHIDGDRLNNDRANLEIVDLAASDPAGWVGK
jgi:prevent-host-death family protein